MAPSAISSDSQAFIADVKATKTTVTHPLDELTGEEVCGYYVSSIPIAF